MEVGAFSTSSTEWSSFRSIELGREEDIVQDGRDRASSGVRGKLENVLEVLILGSRFSCHLHERKRRRELIGMNTGTTRDLLARAIMGS